MFMELKDKLPEEDRAHFQALVDEGRLVAKTSLHAPVNMADAGSRGMALAIVVR